MKHTKGPWRKQGNLIFGAEIGTHVCKLYTQSIPGEKSGADEEKANAALIAAAPEMLEAIEYTMANMEDGDFHVDDEGQYCSDYKKMRDVVKKVRGL